MSRSALPSPFTDFPLALWSAAFVLDVGARWMGPALSFAAFCNMAFGCVIAVLALAAGSLEYNRLANTPYTRRHGLVHATLSAGALLCFTLSLYTRALNYNPFVPPTSAFLLGTAGLVLTLGAAWVGGRLAFELETSEWSQARPERARRTRTA